MAMTLRSHHALRSEKNKLSENENDFTKPNAFLFNQDKESLNTIIELIFMCECKVWTIPTRTKRNLEATEKWLWGRKLISNGQKTN